MPIMVLFRSSRVDRSTYDAIIQQLNLESAPAKGSLTHAAGFDSSGIYVVDVWESRQEFEAFQAERLQPVFAKLKLEIEPPMILDAYAFNATEAVSQYQPAPEAAESRTFRPLET